MLITAKQLLIIILLSSLILYLIIYKICDTIKEIKALKMQYAAKCLEIEKLSRTNKRGDNNG